VPPVAGRVVEASTWLKDWKRRVDPVGRDADAGVAHRERELVRPARPRGRARSPPRSTTSPPIGETSPRWIAGFSSTWRSRVTSPITPGGTPVAHQVGEGRCPSRPRGVATRSSAPLHALPQVERLGLQLEPAGLDLGEVEDVVDHGQQGCHRSDGSPPRSRAAPRRGGCSAAARSCRSPRSWGVRISWLNGGEEGALGLVGGLGLLPGRAGSSVMSW